MCINNKLKTLSFYTLDSDNKVICDDVSMSDAIINSKLSKKTNEKLVPDNDYFFVADLLINHDQGYEIFEILNKSEKYNMRLDYKCFNNNVECSNFKYNIEGLNERTIINKSNWTSGLFPDNLPSYYKEKWSKGVYVEIKYRVKKEMKTLKECDLEFIYKIEKPK